LTSYVPLNRIEHAARLWRRPAGFAFAAEEAIVPLAAIEVAQAATELPLAFATVDGVTQLVAVMSARQGLNWFVGEDGRWLGHYVPALLRAHPFRLVRASPGGQFCLCIAEPPQAIRDGEPIYDEDGGYTARVKAMASFLLTFENSRLQTRRACAALEDAGVLVPWTIRLGAEDGRGQGVEGLKRVDEAALSSLPDDVFLSLRHVGALGVAYAQALSVSRLDLLARLPRIAAMISTEQAAARPRINFLPPTDDDIVF